MIRHDNAVRGKFKRLKNVGIEGRAKQLGQLKIGPGVKADAARETVLHERPQSRHRLKQEVAQNWKKRAAIETLVKRRRIVAFA